MNNLNRIYERLKQSNPNIDDRLARQKAWVIRDRMIYENTAVSSSSAAGAAGAGGGGSGGFRKRNLAQVQDFEKVIALHWVITWADVETDTWKFVVYNYTSGVLSSIIDTGLVYDSSNEWNLVDDENAISESGHSLVFQNSVDNKYKIWFFNSNGQILGVKDLDNNEDFQYTENAHIYLGELNGVSTVYHYDGANVRTHQFPDVDISNIEVDDASDDDVTQDGSIVIEAPDNERWFIARPGGNLVEITNDMSGLNNYRISYNADFIFKTDVDSNIKSISQDGTLKNTFDLTPFSCSSINQSTFYGDNCAYSSLNTNLGSRLLVTYDGDSNEFVSFTFSDSLNASFDGFEINWYYTQPSFGKSFIFYSNTTSQNGTLGYDGTDFEIKWLPKGASSFESHYFGSATISFIDGIQEFTGNRSFSLAENPITMFSQEGGEIMVGFLTSGGFLTQSTAILAASCSNVWGKPIGEKTFAVFDVGSDRVWQVYGATSIEAQTITSTNWSWGSSADDVHRNGTLAVLDTSVGSQSFIYTTEIGLTSGPTYSGEIFNEVDSGSRTGISLEYQLISRYVDGELFTQGFQILSKSGLSEFIDCFPGLSPSSNYNLNKVMIGTELLTLEFSENVTNNIRVQNYKITDLTLIDDYNPGTQSVNVSLYTNRCRILEQDGTTYSVIFVGSNGKETLNIQANDLNTEANDTKDNS